MTQPADAISQIFRHTYFAYRPIDSDDESAMTNERNLADFPARLAEGKLPEWKDYILREAAAENTTHLAKILAQKTGKNYKSIRPPLSDFLNGYSRDVLSWVEPRDDPKDYNDYIEALCKLIDPTANQLFQRFLRLVEQEANSRTVGDEALDYFPLTLQWVSDAYRPAGSAPKIAALTDLRRYLDDQNRSHLLPEDLDDEYLDWPRLESYLLDLQEAIERSTLPLQILISVSWRSADGVRANRLLSELAEFCVQSFCEDQRLFGCHEKQLGPEHDVVEIPLTFCNLEEAQFSTWVKRLKNQYYINADEARRIDQAFHSLPLATVGALSRHHLRYATDYFRDHPIIDSPRRFVELRAQWTRRELTEKTDSAVARQWIADGADAEFFMRCLESARPQQSEWSPCLFDPIVDIEHCLGLQDSPPPAGDDALIKCRQILKELLLSDDATGPALRRQAMGLLPTSLKVELVSEGLLQRSSSKGEKETHKLDKQLIELGLLELALNCDTALLARLDVYADGHSHADTIIKGAAQIAADDQITSWCQYLLEENNRAIQPMLTILDGLAAHPTPKSAIDGQWVHQLWAAAIGLIIEDQLFSGDPALKGVDFNFLANVSESLQHHLPLLDGDEDPLSALLSLIPPSTAADYLIGDATDRSTPTRLLLFQLAPFQLPYREIAELTALVADNDSLELPGHIAGLLLGRGEPIISLARRGDLAARRALLQGSSMSAFADLEIRDQLSTTELLQWWIEIAEQDGREGKYERFEADSKRALDDYFQSPGEALDAETHHELATLLQQALRTPLKYHLPRPLSGIVETFDEGYEALVEFFIHKQSMGYRNDDRGWPKLSILITTVAEWLDARQILRDLCDMNIEALPRLLQHRICHARLPDERGRYSLQFSSLQQLAKLRHRALISLGRLEIHAGEEPQLLRQSLDSAWEISSPIVCRERWRFHRLRHLLSCRGEGLNELELPDLDDDFWSEFLTFLSSRHSLEELRENLFIGLQPFPDEEILYLLSIEHLPQEQRWKSLAPLMNRIWIHRHANRSDTYPGAASIARFWEIIDTFAIDDETEPSAAWSPPHDLQKDWQKARYQWALQNDPHTLRQWCADPNQCDLYQLSTDLSRAHRAWEFLSTEQRAELLRRLARGPVADVWWSRGMELPLEERLQFARKHGTIAQRRDIAEQLLGKYSDSSQAQPYLSKWASLYTDERPLSGPDKEQIERFFEDLPTSGTDTEPSATQLRICGALINSFHHLSTAQILTITQLLTEDYLRRSIEQLPDRDSSSVHIYQRFGGLPVRKIATSEEPLKNKIWTKIQFIFTRLEGKYIDADNRHEITEFIHTQREELKGRLFPDDPA